MNNSDSLFYTYVYLDPRCKGNFIYKDLDYIFEFEPFYVGKGSNNRIDYHVSNKYLNSRNRNIYLKNKILKMKKLGIEPIRIKFKDHLNEEWAFWWEIRLIELIGRKNLQKGPLLNLTDGGEGTSGNILSDETKTKIGKSGENNYFFNRRLFGKDNLMYGKSHSEQTKEKIRQKALERYRNDPEFRLKTGKHNLKTFILIDPQNNKYIVDNLPEFCAKHNLKSTCLYQILCNKQKTHRGWKIDKN